MRNNRMRFGDLIVKQIRGIAMGMSPAPPIVNIDVALHEEREVLPFLRVFSSSSSSASSMMALEFDYTIQTLILTNATGTFFKIV